MAIETEARSRYVGESLNSPWAGEKRISKTEVCSILAVDIGSCKTKAVLFDLVEGRHRFIARGETPTTQHWPIEDISVGVCHAIQRIERATGRTILVEGAPRIPESINGTGVDFFIATTSIGGGLRLLIVTSSTTSSHFQQLRIAAELGAVETEVIALDRTDVAEARHSSLARTLSQWRPHAIFVVAQSGSKASLAELGKDIIEAIAISGRDGLPVRFFGETDAGESFAQNAPTSLDFRDLSQGTDRSGGTSALYKELMELWRQEVAESTPGFATMMSWQKATTLRSSFAYGDALRFLARHWKTSVIGIDIGASAVSLFKILGESSLAKVSTRYGVGRSAIGLLEMDQATGEQAKRSRNAAGESVNLQRWLPFEVQTEEIEASILNKWSRPWTIPETELEALFERALAVESIRRLRAESNDASHFFRYQEKLGLVVGTGGMIAGLSNVGLKALTLLDALEPGGVFEMIVDRDGAVAQIGALGGVWPQAAAEVLLGEGFLNLGVCIAGTGKARVGSKAVSVEIRRGGSLQKYEVNWGDVRALPLEAGIMAEVIVKPHGGLDFGWGKGTTGRFNAKGGALGFIVDARGRPLFDSDSKSSGKTSVEQTSRWLKSLDKREST